MAEEAKVAPAEESKQTEPAITEAAPKEETVGEILQAQQATPKREEETVPLSALLELKKELKENKKALKELKDIQRSADDGATKREVQSSIKELAERHNVDESFLQDLADQIVSKTRSEVEQEITSKFKPLEEEKTAQKVDKIFNEEFTKVLGAMPEYDGVANKDVIRSLAFDPRNSQKTLAQIMEQSYGHLLNGKRTMDSAQPRGNKFDVDVIDHNRAAKDTEYFQTIMSNPAAKERYNAEMMKRVARSS